MPKVALITGITGQDGAYLARFLLNKGYIVHGLKRRSSSFNTGRIDKIYPDSGEPSSRFQLHFGDMTDTTGLVRVLQETQPDEVYNLAAMSHVRVSFDMPEYTGDVDALGTIRLLEAIRLLNLENKTRFYQASTSELFGGLGSEPLSEISPFHPRSPYAVAKLYAYWATVNYREAYHFFACNGILFNHESPFRGETFVTRKITRSVSRIQWGLQKKFLIGNLNAKRDWGHAADYVEGMWMMLQQTQPDDYVLATGETRSVREFIETAFAVTNVSITWKGKGVDEKGYNAQTGELLLEIDPRYFRPTEVDVLLGDARKARNKLGWSPKHSFEDLVQDMMQHDLNNAQKETSQKEASQKKQEQK
ncbi:MAG: GDP-mannose 4,6-dehydratase [Planctomycetaceae bacterium]|jgi:GDPmannose 4,6-dehydratase|nr:GDP-mannose 4,6-dehydratase [Planctomycetaceae bacterium]